MATTFKPRVYGQGVGGYLRPASSGLASSLAGGGSNPFGFQTAKNTTGYRDPLAALTPTGRIVPPTEPYTPPAPRTQPVPATAATGPNTAPTAPGPSAPPGLYDLNTDPALQQVYAYTGQQDQAAQAQALADKTRLVEQAGLASLAQALGLGPDVASVASGNPFSTAANLKHTLDTNTQNLATQNQQQTTDFNNQANAANLWYSGYRQDQLAKLADAFAKAQTETTRGYQGGLSDLAGSVQGQVGQIGSALAQALSGNSSSRIQAEQAARDKAVQAAIANGYTFGGFNPDGSPILIPPTTGTGPAGTTLTVPPPTAQAPGPTPILPAGVGAGVSGGFTFAPKIAQTGAGAGVGGGFSFQPAPSAADLAATSQLAQALQTGQAQQAKRRFIGF